MIWAVWGERAEGVVPLCYLRLWGIAERGEGEGEGGKEEKKEYKRGGRRRRRRRDGDRGEVFFGWRLII